MQLVSFTACLLGILTLLSYCSFTLTCRSQGSELDSVSRRLELWHCPSWRSESRKGEGGKKGEKSHFLIPWLSALKKCTNNYREIGAEGGNACSPSLSGGRAWQRGLLCQPRAASAGLGFQQDPLPLPSSPQHVSFPDRRGPRSPHFTARGKRENKKNRERGGKENPTARIPFCPLRNDHGTRRVSLQLSEEVWPCAMLSHPTGNVLCCRSPSSEAFCDQQNVTLSFRVCSWKAQAFPSLPGSVSPAPRAVSGKP